MYKVQEKVKEVEQIVEPQTSVWIGRLMLKSPRYPLVTSFENSTRLLWVEGTNRVLGFGEGVVI